MTDFSTANSNDNTAANTDGNTDHIRPLVVVTGGSGMLGSALIRALHGDHRVVSLDLEGDPTSPADVDFICTDLTSDDSVERAVERIRLMHGERIASVVHLAAYYDFAGGDSPLYREITVEGTRRLLHAVTPLEVEQFVFSSTMLVHEPAGPGETIDEDDPIEGNWPYPASKVATEQVIGEHPRVARSRVIVRIAGVYDEDGHSPPITNQIKRIDGKWPTSHFYPADPDLGQAFVHLDDAVDAVVRIVRRRRELPDQYEVLIGEPETIGYGELQDIIGRELHGKEWATFQIPVPMAKIGAWAREKVPFGEEPFIKSWMIDRASDHYDLDVTRACDDLDWHPAHRVADVVPEMIERLARDREGWYAENDMRPPRRLVP